MRQQQPQHNAMYMQHQVGPRGMGVGYGPTSMNQANPQRPPNVQVGPDGMSIQQQEWRHLMMTQQQQNMSFSGNSMNRNSYSGGAGHQSEYCSFF